MTLSNLNRKFLFHYFLGTEITDYKDALKPILLRALLMILLVVFVRILVLGLILDSMNAYLNATAEALRIFLPAAAFFVLVFVGLRMYSKWTFIKNMDVEVDQKSANELYLEWKNQ